MRRIFSAGIFAAALVMASTGLAETQLAKAGSARAGGTRLATPATRYFQLTLNLKFGANGEQPETTQTITTEVAVRGTVPGACRARMVSQTPAGNGIGTKYIEVGTKFDADQIHLEGDGVALHFVLSASRPVKMIQYKNRDGVEIEEPIITDRTVELAVKLPLDRAKVVFDSSSKSLAPLKLLVSNTKDDPAAAPATGSLPSPDQPMVIEMTVTEMK